MKTMIIDTVTVIMITKDSSRPGDRENQNFNMYIYKQYLYNYIPDVTEVDATVGERNISGEVAIGEENTSGEVVIGEENTSGEVAIGEKNTSGEVAIGEKHIIKICVCNKYFNHFCNIILINFSYITTSDGQSTKIYNYN